MLFKTNSKFPPASWVLNLVVCFLWLCQVLGLVNTLIFKPLVLKVMWTLFTISTIRRLDPIFSWKTDNPPARSSSSSQNSVCVYFWRENIPLHAHVFLSLTRWPFLCDVFIFLGPDSTYGHFKREIEYDFVMYVLILSCMYQLILQMVRRKSHTVSTFLIPKCSLLLGLVWYLSCVPKILEHQDQIQHIPWS